VKIGIRTFKGLQNGKVLIEADAEEEREALQDQIRHKCGDKLETHVQKRRKLRMIIYNIPDEIIMDNTADIIREQNPELPLKTGDITTKFITKNKRNARKLVIEVDTQTYTVTIQRLIFSKNGPYTIKKAVHIITLYSTPWGIKYLSQMSTTTTDPGM